MSEWMPIETAPAATPEEESTRILVWVANGGGGKGIVDFGWVYIGSRTGARMPKAAHHSGRGWEITHWMPLPEPPK